MHRAAPQILFASQLRRRVPCVRFLSKQPSEVAAAPRDNLASPARLHPMMDLPEKVHFPAEEEKVQELWDRLDAFKTSLKLSEGKPEVSPRLQSLPQPSDPWALSQLELERNLSSAGMWLATCKSWRCATCDWRVASENRASIGQARRRVHHQPRLVWTARLQPDRSALWWACGLPRCRLTQGNPRRD